MLPITETSETEAVLNEFPGRSKIVERLLRPRIETDQAGFKRQIYQYGDLTFSFRGREELPEYQAIRDAQTILLGSNPVHIDPTDFQQYRKNIITANENNPKDTPKHYLATKDIQGVIALAIELGANNPDLTKMLSEVKLGVYSDKTLDLIDKLVAVNCVSDDGTAWTEKLTRGDAEALVVLSLLGNREAEAYLSVKCEQMRKLDSLRGNEEEKIDTHDFEKSVCVHATNYMPIAYEDGSWGVRTTGDATGWQYVRNTIHATLNHKVASHLMGKWGLCPYTLLSPMSEVVRVNGLPKSDQEWDIWWTRNPGETLKFPNAFLVKPGEMPHKRILFVVGDRIVTHKSDGYTINDLLGLEKTEGDSYPYSERKSTLDILDLFNKTVFYPINSELRVFLDANWDVEKLAQLMIDKYFPKESYPGERADKKPSEILKHHIWDDKIFNQRFRVGEDISVSERVKEILEDIEAFRAFKGQEKDLEKVLEGLSLYIGKNIENEIFSRLNSLVVRAVIKQMGFKPSMGGNWPSAHVDSPYNWFTIGHRAYIDRRSKEIVGENNDGTYILGKFNWAKFDPEWPSLPQIDPKTRRVLYASGAFNSRIE